MDFRFVQFNPEDRSQVVEVTKTDLHPRFMTLSQGRSKAILTALVGVQALSEYELERFWESLLPPFSLSEMWWQLFEWIRVALISERDPSPNDCGGA